MQRKSFPFLLLKTLGFAVIGNIMAFIVTLSLAAFIDSSFLQFVSAVISVFLYHSMIFISAYQDGQREIKMLSAKRIDSYIKWKWLKIGVIIGIIMCIPSVILALSRFNVIGYDFLIPFRLISGGAYSLSMLLSTGMSIGDLYSFAPFIFMLIYLLSPLSCEFGFYCITSEKFTADKIIYKQKK